MNSATVVLFFALALGILYDLHKERGRESYRCPSCNARNAKDHTDECSWKKHYGEEF